MALCKIRARPCLPDPGTGVETYGFQRVAIRTNLPPDNVAMVLWSRFRQAAPFGDEQNMIINSHNPAGHIRFFCVKMCVPTLSVYQKQARANARKQRRSDLNYRYAFLPLQLVYYK